MASVRIAPNIQGKQVMVQCAILIDVGVGNNYWRMVLVKTALLIRSLSLHVSIVVKTSVIRDKWLTLVAIVSIVLNIKEP